MGDNSQIAWIERIKGSSITNVRMIEKNVDTSLFVWREVPTVEGYKYTHIGVLTNKLIHFSLRLVQYIDGLEPAYYGI